MRSLIFKKKKKYPDIFIVMIKVFTFGVYAFLYPGESLSFVTPYVSNKFDILSKKHYEPFCVSTPIVLSIPQKRAYHDCVISINHKNTMAYLVELDLVEFNVILGMDGLHACYALLDCRNRVDKF